MSFTIKNLSYTLPNREILFQNISFSLTQGQKVSLIGNNGSGKSTLLKILSGNLQAAEGEILFAEKPYYVPQHFGQYNQLTIAEALVISEKISALNKILEGDASIDNFNKLDDDWEIEERAKIALTSWGLEKFSLHQPMKDLSGGEKTKVFLSGITIHSPSIILMDEPTNHLDTKSRLKLYEFIREASSTILIVSHDRNLLNLLSPTYELKKEGINLYGGNYEFYKIEKDKSLALLQNQLIEKEKELRKTKKAVREIIEKQNKHAVRGEKSNIKKGVPRIVMGNLKSKSENTSAKLKDIHSGKMEDIAGKLSRIRSKLGNNNELKLNIESAKLHEGKLLAEGINLNFSYHSNLLWQENLSFQIRSGERIAIKGENGSGKTTLVNLILGKLLPTKGSIKHSEFKYIYIDQEYSLIEDNITIYEQVQNYNSQKLLEHEIKMLLNRFLFPKETWDKLNKNLSGGEKMRLLLCCLQVSNNIPDLIIMDEPTNNLDIRSLEILTSTIQFYRGTLLLISHDEYFLEEMNINKIIEL